MNILKDKKAVVTGGAMGIGFAIVRRLLDEECVVAVWDNNADAIRSARKSWPVFRQDSGSTGAM